MSHPPLTPSTTKSSGFGFSPLGPVANYDTVPEASVPPVAAPVITDTGELGLFDGAGVGWGGLDANWNFPIDIFQDLWTEQGYSAQS